MAEHKTIRVGFVGCGRHSGRRLYPGLEEAGLQLVAVCDEDEQKARERATRYGVPHVYTDWRAMCQSHEMDAVLVVTGPHGHYTLGKELLDRGYHVFLEKPAAATTQQAAELLERATSAGRHMQIGFNYRYSMGVQRAISMIESGRFASPVTVTVRWYLGEPDTSRFMQHYVCHAIDLLHYVTPGGLMHVDPASDLHVEYQRQDNFDWYVVTMRSPRGAIAVLELAAQMSGEGHHARIDFMSRDGLLSVLDFTQVTHYETAPWGDLRKPGSKEYDGDRVWRTEPLLTRGPIWQTYGYTAELIRFREAIQGLREREATIEEAVWGMRIMDRFVEAASL